MINRREFLHQSLVSGVAAAGGLLLAAKPRIAKAQTVNVRNPPYNATGNGVTDDSYPIFRALQDADNVYVPAGTYFVSANFQLTRPGQHLYGDGMEATFFTRWTHCKDQFFRQLHLHSTLGYRTSLLSAVEITQMLDRR